MTLPQHVLGRRQIVILSLLLVIGIVNYIDRSTLSIGNTSISQDMRLNATQMGLLLSVFSWSYAFAQLPAGPMLDRFGARLVLGGGLFFWSVAQALAGVVRSFGEFIVARLLLGVGEAPMFPANAKVVAETFPKEKRGLPLGVTTAASTIGPAIAPPVLTWLLLAFGWRVMFVVTGIVGVLLSLVWLMVYRNPDTVAQLDGAMNDEESHPRKAKWSLREWLWLLRFRTTWSMIGGYIGVIYSIYLYLTWLPAYLQNAHRMSIASIGWALILPYVAGTAGQLIGGISGDYLVRSGMSIVWARKWPVVSGLAIGGLFSIPAALSSTAWVAIACICGAQLFINMAASGGWAMAATLADERTTGSLGSLQNFGGYFGGAFAPLITGFLVSTTGSFVLALLLASVVALVAAGLYAWGVRQVLPPFPEFAGIAAPTEGST